MAGEDLDDIFSFHDEDARHSEIESPRDRSVVRAESDLKRFLRELIPRRSYDRIVHDQMSGHPLPALQIPDRHIYPLKFTPDYCELVADVVTELIQAGNLSRVDYESFLEATVTYFARIRSHRRPSLLPDLERDWTQRVPSFGLEFCDSVADFLLRRSLSHILHI
jgi:hypothetical protein